MIVFCVIFSWRRLLLLAFDFLIVFFDFVHKCIDFTWKYCKEQCKHVLANDPSAFREGAVAV